jgi:predicted PurR-regulated permease PerM
LNSDWLASRGVSRSTSILFISLIILTLLIITVVIVVPLVSEQWATITALLSTWYQDLRTSLIESPSLLVRRIARQLPVVLPLTLPTPPPGSVPEEEAVDLAAQAFNIGSAIIRGLLLVVGVALLTGFWIIEGERSTRLLLAAVPQSRRDSVREIWEEIQDRVGAYTLGLVVLSSIIGVMSTIAYAIIGLPNVIVLGIIAGVMEAVPLVGPLLGAIPAVIVAVAYDPSKVIWVIIATIIIQMSENNLIVPRVMNKAVGVNPVASLLAFIAFGSIFGLVGALLAIPLAAIIQIALRRLLFQASTVEQPVVMGRDSVSILRYEAQELIQDVRKQVREKEIEPEESADQVEDTMEAIVQDLDSILAQIETKTDNGDQQA